MARTYNKRRLLGWEGLLGAVCKLAWRDLQKGNGHAREARDFLLDEGLMENLELFGVDRGEYRRLVRGGRDLDGECRARVRQLWEAGWSKGEIGRAVYGGMSVSRQFELVTEALVGEDGGIGRSGIGL